MASACKLVPGLFRTTTAYAGSKLDYTYDACFPWKKKWVAPALPILLCAGCGARIHRA